MRFVADVNFNKKILRGLRRRTENFEFVRLQDIGFARLEDPAVLEWAWKEDRLLLTHDVNTMIGFFNERLAAGLPVPGVFEISSDLSIRTVIDELLTIIEYSTQDEWTGKLTFIPLR